MILIAIISLYGCSSNEKETSAEGDAKPESNMSIKTEKSNSGSSKQKVPSNLENLKIGDSAVIQSTLGTAEITIHSFRKEKDIKGVGPQLSQFLVADTEIKNVGDNEINAMEWMDILEMVWDLEGDGSPDDSDVYEVQAIDKVLKPGESAKGETIFDTEDTDEFYLMVDRPMIAGGSVYNNAVWTISESEIK